MSTDLITLSGATMGTRYVAQFSNCSPHDEQLAQNLQRAVTEIDLQMSPWIETSFVNRFNAAPIDDWIEIPSQSATVIKKALDIERKSGGAFSIAVAPQVRHNGFGTLPRQNGNPPKMGVLAANAIEFGGTLIRKSEPIEIDLCGIAKGYGVDILAETMIAHDVRNFMVSIDGELRCQGTPAPNQLWQVALEDPVQGVRKTAAVVPCGELALATSGGYRNFDQTEAGTITHTIDPKTGTPLQDSSTSVSVAHHSCCEADAWATALLVMPIEAALTCIHEHRLNALFLKQIDNDTLCMPHGIFAVSHTS